MTLTAMMYAALPGVRLPDATSWPLPDTAAVGAFWNVATRRWEVLELVHEQEGAPLASYGPEERAQAERHARRVWRELLKMVG